MILVTVGTHTAPFDRLVRAADAYAGTTGERVVIQRGAARYVPVTARSFGFCDSVEMEQLILESRVVVCHAADSILDAIRLGRPVVTVPRQYRYGEHLNDHQVHLAAALAERALVVPLYDLAGLAEAINTAAQMGASSWPGEPPLALAIRSRLREWFPSLDGSQNRQPESRGRHRRNALNSR